ncbi:MAG: tetratricopeptide repeat protein [Candidatus Kerfeldbacteria bacterium]|nr:tetratricopeptide repeat protein [Candidatus Kerfeldbacteria bacterium]
MATGNFDLTDQGRAALRYLDRDAAEACFRQALEETPDFVDAIAGLGQVAYERGELAVAAREFDRAVTLAKQQLGGDWPTKLRYSDPTERSYLRALHGVGLVLYRRGNAAAAQETFTFERQLDPADHQGSRFLLAKIKRGQAWGR